MFVWKSTHEKRVKAMREEYRNLQDWFHERGAEIERLEDDLLRARAERDELYRDAMKHRASIAPLAAANAKKSAEAKAKREKV